MREVVIATNATTTGEATALYLADSLRERAPEVAVTRLASGLPVGSDLEYADEITLGTGAPRAARRCDRGHRRHRRRRQPCGLAPRRPRRRPAARGARSGPRPRSPGSGGPAGFRVRRRPRRCGPRSRARTRSSSFPPPNPPSALARARSARDHVADGLSRGPRRLPARLPRHLRDARDRRGRPGRARGRAIPSTRSRPGSSAARCRTTSTASTRPTGILHPLVRDGAKGEGQLPARSPGTRRSTAWRASCSRVRDEHGGEAILPYSYAGTQGLIQGNTMSARVMHALGATSLERTICATAGMVGIAATHGISPEVDPDEWHHARHLLVWGWNPMSTAPHLWRKLLEARRAGARLVVVDPFRSRTARVADEHLRPIPGTDAALAIGMMRAVRGRRPPGRGLVPRPRRRATTSCSRSSPTTRSSAARRSAAWTPRRSRARDATSPPPGPRCSASGSAPSATWARPPPTPRSRRCRCSPAPGASAAAAAPTSRWPRRQP